MSHSAGAPSGAVTRDQNLPQGAETRSAATGNARNIAATAPATTSRRGAGPSDRVPAGISADPEAGGAEDRAALVRR